MIINNIKVGTKGEYFRKRNLSEYIIDGRDGDKDSGSLSNDLFYYFSESSQGFNDGYFRSQVEGNQDADGGSEGMKHG